MKKWFKTIREGRRYLRIVAKRKEVPDFDLKIIPYQT